MGSPGTAVLSYASELPFGSLGRLAGGRISVGLVKPRFLTKQSLFCLQWCMHWVNTGNALLLFMMGAPIVCVSVAIVCCAVS